MSDDDKPRDDELLGGGRRPTAAERLAQRFGGRKDAAAIARSVADAPLRDGDQDAVRPTPIAAARPIAADANVHAGALIELPPGLAANHAKNPLLALTAQPLSVAVRLRSQVRPDDVRIRATLLHELRTMSKPRDMPRELWDAARFLIAAFADYIAINKTPWGRLQPNSWQSQRIEVALFGEIDTTKKLKELVSSRSARG